jgi:hypothetical protein
MRWIIFLFILRPLIAANYWLRGRRLIADKCFWADDLAFSWGYSHDPERRL